jgi:cytochrome c
MAASFRQTAGAVKGAKVAPRPLALTIRGPSCFYPAASRGDAKEGSVKRIGVVFAALALTASASAASAAGDAAAGETKFKVCRICHQIGDNAKNFVGPDLNGVVGRRAGSVPGYNYSDANRNSGITWDEATLAKYLRNPREIVPGTKMAFPGLSKEDDIADVIAYLKQFGPDGKKM